MVVIRLSRGGAKKRPFYHIVVTNSRNARDGRFIERLGFYNPIAKGEEVKIQLNHDRVAYWTEKGAKPSERVQHLIDNFAEIAADTLQKQPKKAKKEAPAPVEAEAPAEEQVAEETPAAEPVPVTEEAKEAEPEAPAEEPKEEKSE